MGKKKKEAPPPHLDLPEAPCFYPSEEEWRDPLKYCAEVVRCAQQAAGGAPAAAAVQRGVMLRRPLAARCAPWPPPCRTAPRAPRTRPLPNHRLPALRRPAVEHTSGICRVVPPAAWVEGLRGQCAIDRASLKFNARVQRVDQLQRKHTAVASQRFWNEYQAWMAANGVRRKGGKLNPVFNGRDIELDRFHAAVARRGGYEAVTEDRGWRDIANVLDVRACWGAAAAAVAAGGRSTCARPHPAQPLLILPSPPCPHSWRTRRATQPSACASCTKSCSKISTTTAAAAPKAATAC